MSNWRLAGILSVVFACHGFGTCAGKKPWLRIRSEHFTVITDAGEKRGVEVARHCEDMRAAFSILMNRANTHDPAPLLILAVNGQKEIDDLGRAPASRLQHAGIFLPGAGESFILVDASGDLSHTVFHEYAHELLYANTVANVQTWFDEGFAEYFSTLETQRNRTKVGQVPLADLQFLRENGKLMHLVDLVRVDQTSAVYNQNSLSEATFYAESWLLVHYLFDHQLIGQVQPFFAMMASGTDIEHASQTSFGMTTRELEDALLAYAKGESFRFFSLPAVTGSNSNLKVEEISAGAIEAVKADVRWHLRTSHTEAEAEAYAGQSRDLLAREPNNPAALRGLGVALLSLGEYDEAQRNFSMAITADPDSVLNHYALGVLLDTTERSAISTSASAAEEEAERCTELDPDFADAYQLLASAYARQGRLKDSLAAVQKAIALSPRDEIYSLNLASLWLKLHQYSDALALLRRLKASHNPEISRKADSFLSTAVEH